MADETVWNAANEVPPEWYGGDLADMEKLAEKLLSRRGRIRELIEAFRDSDRKPFPNWGTGAREIGEETWQQSRMGRYDVREGELKRTVVSDQWSVVSYWLLAIGYWLE